MNVAAPKSCLFGSQAWVVRKPRPNSCIAGHASVEELARDQRQEDDAAESSRERDDVEDRVPGAEAAPPLEGGGAGDRFRRDCHSRRASSTSGPSSASPYRARPRRAGRLEDQRRAVLLAGRQRPGHERLQQRSPSRTWSAAGRTSTCRSDTPSRNFLPGGGLTIDSSFVGLNFRSASEAALIPTDPAARRSRPGSASRRT